MQRLFAEIEKEFCFDIRFHADAEQAGLTVDGGILQAAVPSGHVARVSVDALVPREHFNGRGRHPSVIDPGLKQYATRSVNDAFLAFPSLATRVETLRAFSSDDEKWAVAVAADMIFARPIERSRRYDIVTRSAMPDGDGKEQRIRLWRTLGEIDVTSQRWRPTGRPIYRHVAPKEYRTDDGRGIVASALPLKPPGDGPLAQFENEAFFDRPNIDAQTVTQKLAPLPSTTVLQQHFWDAPSATYFRHRFTLRSRYSGAQSSAADGELATWVSDRKKPTTAWTMRVAMLADLSRIILTRPQLRALIPLPTAPGDGGTRRSAPPVLGLLQEPPFSRGGLADRIDAEIKTGFGYGFAIEDPLQEIIPVEVLNSRKEIGPTPYLGYRPIDPKLALGLTLLPEGPIGLTFDEVNASAAAFPNSLITLSPIDVGTDGEPSGTHSLEEHLLGVSLRRHIDPKWTAEESTAPENFDGERCWWIETDLDPEMSSEVALLQYRVNGLDAPLVLVKKDNASFVLGTHKIVVDGYVEGLIEHRVDLARLAGNFSQKLAILHQPIAPGRYSLSIFAVAKPQWANADQGRTTAPLMLASFEWSPARELSQSGKPRHKPAMIALTAGKGATVVATIASASTSLAWTRTGRNVDFLYAGELRKNQETAEQYLASKSTHITQFVAMLTSDHKEILLKRSGAPGQPAWLISSTFLSEFPLHVHRHLGAITTRYLKEPGRPIETFCRSAMLAEAVSALAPATNQGQPYPAEECVRVIEFEMPATILCGTNSDAIAKTYRQAYFDLVATGFKPEAGGGAFRLLIRLVGGAAHVRSFNSVVVSLSNVDQPARQIEVQLDNAADDFTKAVEIRLSTSTATLSAVLLRASGNSRVATVTTISEGSFTIDAATNSKPGFFMTIAAGGGIGEFWADVSILHSPKAAFPEGFDFDWLFSGAGSGEPVVDITPRGLRRMTEAQARIIAVSPPIPIVSHNE